MLLGQQTADEAAIPASPPLYQPPPNDNGEVYLTQGSNTLNYFSLKFRQISKLENGGIGHAWFNL